jgi:hypothetical protein
MSVRTENPLEYAAPQQYSRFENRRPRISFAYVSIRDLASAKRRSPAARRRSNPPPTWPPPPPRRLDPLIRAVKFSSTTTPNAPGGPVGRPVQQIAAARLIQEGDQAVEPDAGRGGEEEGNGIELATENSNQATKKKRKEEKSVGSFGCYRRFLPPARSGSNAPDKGAPRKTPECPGKN